MRVRVPSPRQIFRGVVQWIECVVWDHEVAGLSSVTPTVYIGRWPNWLRFVIWDHESAGSSPVLPTGSNLVVIKTQGVLKGYTGDNYSSHRVEDGILYGEIC